MPLFLALVLATGCSSDDDEASDSAQAAASGETGPQGFKLRAEPQELPEVPFTDGDGNPMTFAHFEGQVVVLNVWATWCPPCREEMPTLDRLQAELGSSEFKVVTLSIDQAGVSVVDDFFADIDVQHLTIYIDETGQAARKLDAFGVPTTLLLDREGRELGRLVGEADWHTRAMVEFFREIVERTK